jgi:hypothetical protein
MHPERVVFAKVSAVVTTFVAIITVVATVVVAAAVGAFGSLLLGHLFLIVQIIIFPSSSHLQARATFIRIVTIPIVLRLGRHLLVILPLHASDARRDAMR